MPLSVKLLKPRGTCDSLLWQDTALSLLSRLKIVISRDNDLCCIGEILKVKQSILANEPGSDWNQKKISQLEDKETIVDALPEEIAGALKVPVEAIENFDDKRAVMTIIADTINNNDQSASVSNTSVIDSIEKWMNVLEENKKLCGILIEVKREKIAFMERLFTKKVLEY